MEARLQLPGDPLLTADCTSCTRSTARIAQVSQRVTETETRLLTESMTSTCMPSLLRCRRKTAGRGLTDFPVPISKISGGRKTDIVKRLLRPIVLVMGRTHRAWGPQRQRPRICFRPSPSITLKGHPKAELLPQERYTPTVTIFRLAAVRPQVSWI